MKLNTKIIILITMALVLTSTVDRPDFNLENLPHGQRHRRPDRTDGPGQPPADQADGEREAVAYR